MCGSIKGGNTIAIPLFYLLLFLLGRQGVHKNQLFPETEKRWGTFKKGTDVQRAVQYVAVKANFQS